MTERSTRLLVVIGPGEESVGDAVRDAAGRALPVMGSGRDVAGLAAVLSGVRALVGNDSGPMQLASLLGTPVIALFGPTDRVRTGPRGAKHRIVTASVGSEDRIADISVEDVEVAVLEVVQQHP